MARCKLLTHIQLFISDECLPYYQENDDAISLGPDDKDIKEFLIQMGIDLYHKHDIIKVESTFNDFGLPSAPADKPDKSIIATQEEDRIYITSVPQHIYAYILKHCIPICRNSPDNAGTDNTNEKLDVNTSNGYDSDKENRDPEYDSGFEDECKSTASTLSLLLDIEDDLQLSRPEDGDVRPDDTRGKDTVDSERIGENGEDDNKCSKDTDTKANDWDIHTEEDRCYQQTFSANRYDRERYNQNEISIRETNLHRRDDRPQTTIDPSGFSKEQRVRYRSQRQDLVDTADEYYSGCRQCKIIPRRKISLGSHKRSLVRSRLVIHDFYPANVMDVDAFFVWNSMQKRPTVDTILDYERYGRQTYWQDPTFYKNMVQEAQFRLVKRFPVKPLLQVKASVTMTPVCITYPTVPRNNAEQGDLNVIVYQFIEGPHITNADEPRHQPDGELDTEVDAEFTITFRLTYDMQPSMDLQLKASEDELVQRLKDITIGTPNTSLTNMAKLILAYAAFQERQHDKDFENNWRVHTTKAAPIEELLDLRTQLDLKHKQTKEDLYTRVYSKEFNRDMGQYPTYTHLPGLKRRYERIQERKRYGVPRPVRARTPPGFERRRNAYTSISPTVKYWHHVGQRSMENFRRPEPQKWWNPPRATPTPATRYNTTTKPLVPNIESKAPDNMAKSKKKRKNQKPKNDAQKPKEDEDKQPFQDQTNRKRKHE